MPLPEFDRTSRQDEIWERLNIIREMYDQPSCLLAPAEGMPDHADVVALALEFSALFEEYRDIHIANGTMG